MRTAKQAVKNGNPNGDKDMKHHRHENDDNRIKVAILENNISHINETLVKIEKRLDSLEYRMDEQFKKVDEKFNKIDEKFNKIDEKFEKVDMKIEKLNEKMDSNFKWIMGTIIISIILPIVTKFIH